MQENIKAVIQQYKKYIVNNQYTVMLKDLTTTQPSDIRIQVLDFLLNRAGIDILSKLTVIPMNAFKGYSGFTNLVIPGNVLTIGESAFEGCQNLTSVEIESGVTTLGKRAFSDCPQLRKVRLAESVTNLGSEVFTNTNAQLVVVTEYRSSGSANRLKIKQADVDFYRQHLRFTHSNIKKEGI